MLKPADVDALFEDLDGLFRLACPQPGHADGGQEKEGARRGSLGLFFIAEHQPRRCLRLEQRQPPLLGRGILAKRRLDTFLEQPLGVFAEGSKDVLGQLLLGCGQGVICRDGFLDCRAGQEPIETALDQGAYLTAADGVGGGADFDLPEGDLGVGAWFAPASLQA